MLHRISGRSGSGKSDYIFDIIAGLADKNEKVLYIVPEQQALSAEKAIASKVGNRYNMYCEVTNFERLPDIFYRESGLSAPKYIDAGGRTVLLAAAMRSLRDEMLVFGSIAEDAGFCTSVLGYIDRLRFDRVMPEMLRTFLDSGLVDKEDIAVKKLSDLTQIYTKYCEFFDESLADRVDSLETLASFLSRVNFFKGYTVFIDGHYSFKEQELEIIRCLIAQCDDVYISFMYAHDDKNNVFGSVEATYKRIGRLSENSEDVYLTGRRSADEMLEYLEENIWNVESGPFCGENKGSIKIIEAENEMLESEAIASEIYRLVRDEGLRFCDISVVFGDSSSYSAVLPIVLERDGIPYYMSLKDEILSQPLFSFSASCLEMIAEDFPLYAVKKYIKSGFSGLSAEEEDLLLGYAGKWNINGKMWYREREWAMNPDGYKGELSGHGEYILAEVNKAREKLVMPIRILMEDITESKTTVTEALLAFYRFLIDTGADKTVIENAQLAREEESEEEAQKQRQLWDILINIIDQIHITQGNETMKPKALYSMFVLACGSYSVGSIPTSADQVRIGEANTFRPDSCKAVILSGVTDGVFPGSGGKDAFFSERELCELGEAAGSASLSVRLGISRSERLLNEQFYFYASICCASDFVVLTYPSSSMGGSTLTPSIGARRVASLFPQVGIYKFGKAGVQDYCYCIHSSVYHLSEMNETDKKTVLGKLNGQTLPQGGLLFDPEASIVYSSGSLNLSPSSIDKYFQCPFSFFGDYILRLNNTERIEFDPLDSGSLMHYVLEKTIAGYMIEGGFSAPDIERIRADAHKHTEEYIAVSTSGTRISRTLRLSFDLLKSRVTEALEDICEELSCSKFYPVAVEKSINIPGEGAISVPGVIIDGRLLNLRGKIDRIDISHTDEGDYVRVIDYKSSKKDIKLMHIEKGLDMQMLIYLFLYSDNTQSIPAGICYLGLKKEYEKGVSYTPRSWLVAKNDEICSEFYLPKKGNVVENMDELKRMVTDNVEYAARGIINGRMNIAPSEVIRDRSPCRYCRMKPVCRKGDGNQEQGGDPDGLD